MIEIYRPIPGFPFYEVSNLGNVLSLRSDKVLAPKKHNKGYLKVSIFANGKQSIKFIDRLVLEVFKGPFPSDKPQARHLDGDPTNNSIWNLEFGNQSDNEEDKKRHGRFNHVMPHQSPS